MLRIIEWGVQNGPVRRKRVLPLTALFILKIFLNFHHSIHTTCFYNEYQFDIKSPIGISKPQNGINDFLLNFFIIFVSEPISTNLQLY